MIRIAIVYGTLVHGGADKALLTMLKMMDYSKYNITLFLEHDDGPLQNLLDSRVKVKSWEHKNDISYLEFLKKLFKQYKIGLFLISIWYRLLAHIFNRDIQRNERYAYKSQNVGVKNEQYDIVISYQALSYWHLLYARNHIKSKKYICWIHGNMNYMENDDKVMLPKLFNWFDVCVCVSNSVKESFLYYSPKLEKKSLVIYNLFDIEEIEKSANQPIKENIDGLSFATVGRMSYEKGQKMIPFIAKELLELGYKFKWYVVGDGLDFEIVREQIHNLNLDNVVILTGMKDNPYPYIKKCNLYIQTSYTEGFCLTTFEARILERHMVVTDIPVMRELFAENEVVFCEPTVPSLVNGIQKAISLIDTPVKYSIETNDFNRIQLEKIDELLNR